MGWFDSVCIVMGVMNWVVVLVIVICMVVLVFMSSCVSLVIL